MKIASFSTVKALDPATPGEFSFRVSGPKLDRDGEIVDAATLQLRKRFPVFMDHTRTMQSMVATASATMDGEEMVISGKFINAPMAQTIRNVLDDADHREAVGMSIGAINATRVLKDGTPTWSGGELMEVSFTGIPAYPDTKLLTVKSAGGDGQSTKSVQGSFEERSQLIGEALRSIEDGYPYVSATFDDTIIYEKWDDAKGAYVTNRRTYSISDAGVSLGDAEAVEVVTTVQPVAAEATKDAGDDADLTPAPVAADGLAKSSAAISARVALALAEVALSLD